MLNTNLYNYIFSKCWCKGNIILDNQQKKRSLIINQKLTTTQRVYNQRIINLCNLYVSLL